MEFGNNLTWRGSSGGLAVAGSSRIINLTVAQFIAVSEGFVFVIPSAGPEPSAQCELSPVNASHPVQAFMESFTVLSGCASRGTTGLPQEVHVLNLRAADPGLGQPQREVGADASFLLTAPLSL